MVSSKGTKSGIKMAKGESIMKPNKEQKGKHAVLVIAVGKHPQMGPGPRNYKKNKKGMKKAFVLLKDDAKRAERQKKFENRLALRQQRQKEMDAYNEGTASEEVKQKIEQSKANTASGVNQNLRFAQKEGGSQRKRMPKKEAKPFDTEHFDRWVESNSLGDRADPSSLSSNNLMVLARKLGMKPADIENKQFEGADIGAMKAAMQQLGKQRFEEREKIRRKKTVGGDDKKIYEDYKRNQGADEDGSDYDDDEMWSKLHEKFQDKDEVEDEGEIMAQIMERLKQSRSFQHPQEDDDDYESEGISGHGDLRTEPGGGTIPFGASGGVEGGAKSRLTPRSGRTLRVLGPRKRSEEATFEEEVAGFMPPQIPTHFSSPQEEEEEEDLPEYGQFTYGEPMDLAFRLLKAKCPCECPSNCKCECCKSNPCECSSSCECNTYEDNEDSDKQFLEMCQQCGVMLTPQQFQSHQC